MLRAAFTSALPAYPQAVHRNRAWLSRDLPSTRPHAEHRWLVYAAGTFSTRPGATAILALPRRFDPRPARASLRWRRHSRARSLALRPGAVSNSPVDRAALTLTPRSMPTASGPGPPRGGQLPGLLQVARRGTASRTPPGVLLDREVPHVPGVRAVPQQDGFLLAGRLEAVSGHANIIPDYA